MRGMALKKTVIVWLLHGLPYGAVFVRCVNDYRKL